MVVFVFVTVNTKTTIRKTPYAFRLFFRLLLIFLVNFNVDVLVVECDLLILVQNIILGDYGITHPIRNRPIPLENIALVVALLVGLVMVSSRTRPTCPLIRHAWRTDRLGEVEGFLEACLQTGQDLVVERLSVKLAKQALFEHFVELLWKHHEQLLRVCLLQSLHQVVLEFVVQASELFFEIGPRQLLVVDEVDEHVEGGLDVVSARLVVTTA